MKPPPTLRTALLGDPTRYSSSVSVYQESTKLSVRVFVSLSRNQILIFGNSSRLTRTRLIGNPKHRKTFLADFFPVSRPKFKTEAEKKNFERKSNFCVSHETEKRSEDKSFESGWKKMGRRLIRLKLPWILS